MLAPEVVAAWRTLPVADFAAIAGGRAILVLAPHPDDETLGCGGLIAEACARGRPVHVAVLTDGAGSHPRSTRFPPPRLAALRQSEARAAVQALGLAADCLQFLGCPDGAVPRDGSEFDALAGRLAAVASRLGVGTICATWAHEPHPDHAAAAAIAAEVARRTGARHLAYPIWAWSLPASAELPASAACGVRLDIARHLAAKQRAMAAHASQTAGAIPDDPEPRLPDALLANFRQPFEVFLEPP